MLRKLAFIGAVVAVAIGCSGPGADETSSPSRSVERAGGTRDASAFMSPDGGGGFGESDARTVSAGAADRSGTRAQIRGASLDMRVSHLDDAEKKVQGIIKQCGGYEQSLTSSDLASSNASLSIVAKVPVAKLDDVIGQIEGLGTRTAKTISMEDVTDQLVSWDTRMSTLKQRKEALSTSKRKLTDSDQYQIRNLNDEMVSIQHQRDALAEQVSFSTLELRITQGAVAGSLKDASWYSEAYGESSSAAASAFRLVASAFLWLLFMSPFYLPFVIGGWFIYRSRKRGKVAAPAA